ncbi:hypothetical protein HNO88_002539 [Novosphingobium chloroacetimidivorans]|uniref:Uncharacterized protein n=1 Tax=Novosphingobium chloroacetimidivorans TaxID=1428314 RepID=A0A7W7KAH8_9SPHN|nr:hypothetical protein [Novosphingobium chloroacetimidivorans]MBB4859210.1 hypothetical protein [Novosphingobium chloroacetimidivorans]
MMRTLISTLLVASSAVLPIAAKAAPAPVSTAAAKTAAAYKVDETDLGTLMDDAASKAILLKYIPEIVNNPQIAMGRGMTLSQLQQFAGEQLTDETLAKIQADLTAAKPS